MGNSAGHAYYLIKAAFVLCPRPNSGGIHGSPDATTVVFEAFAGEGAAAWRPPTARATRPGGHPNTTPHAGPDANRPQ
jgi:hypothetical protein